MHALFRTLALLLLCPCTIPVSTSYLVITLSLVRKQYGLWGQSRHQFLTNVILRFDKCDFEVSELLLDKECKEYDDCTFKLNDKNIIKSLMNLNSDIFLIFFVHF